jgi:hypothetical protein
MVDKGYETHSNDEPIRKCPYCEWEGASRGLTFHVLNKSDEKHDEKYELPDDFEASEAEIVGYENVDVEMPDSYNVEHKTRYVCDYCGKICRGSGGLKVHLQRLAGDEVHPDDAEDREPDSFPQFKVGEDGQLVPQDDASLEVATGGAVGDESGSLEEQDVVPVEELEQLRDSFVEEGDNYDTISPGQAAQRVQQIIDKYQ